MKEDKVNRILRVLVVHGMIHEPSASFLFPSVSHSRVLRLGWRQELNMGDVVGIVRIIVVVVDPIERSCNFFVEPEDILGAAEKSAASLM
jgi:hypothetical protein